MAWVVYGVWQLDCIGLELSGGMRIWEHMVKP